MWFMGLAENQVNQIIKLHRILDAKGWSNREYLGNIVFEPLAKLICNLSSAEANLFLHLLNEYEWPTADEMAKAFNNIASNIPIELLAGSDRIICLPMIAEKDLNNATKSGHLAIYQFAMTLKQRQDLRSIQVVQKLSISAVSKEEWKGKVCVIFLDDFIGSGDTAASALEHYRTNFFKHENTVALAAPFALTTGIEKINKLGVKLFVQRELKRGITDDDTIENRTEARALMREIEGRLRVSKQFRFGYKRSEALITVSRTPNNTFPIFWHSGNFGSSGDPVWTAPFPR